jgi:glycerol kinase
MLMQFQADLLGVPVLRPRVRETTALGAALMAGLGAGCYRSMDELCGLWQLERRFEPNCSPEKREERMARWALAVQRARFMG